ncbi:hypothetical protein Alches_05260 [Alicyclobacillus hesperidum subsp. aegles]|uniref:hypothetical protein n=1 Tax=Alicyclobacillus hesperidum TaxID=89784 RepID=UPI00222D0F7D|nr:hypothetical protein [Alicyclobacillus hesperidum]GLG00487.1 hypothetical protein Alches_05260 [Alicyclobacillus hesperidum subsp. aegles]
MQAEPVKNWRVMGSSTTSGGSYNHINVMGEAVTTGDMECQLLRVMGMFQTHADVQVGYANIMGQMDVGGQLRGHRVRVMGELTVHGDCEVEQFLSRGAFSIDGLLNAGTIDVRLYGPCHVREIGCGSLRVSLKKPLFGRVRHVLTADVIEGDDVMLTYTKAHIVRGDRIRIGLGCDIDKIEYKTEYACHPRAHVASCEQRGS